MLAEVASGAFNWDNRMQYFMATYFLVFSFFKLQHLKGFAERYATHGVIAKKRPGKISEAKDINKQPLYFADFSDVIFKFYLSFKLIILKQ